MMKPTQKIISIFLILANTFILSGCWNYVEINDKAVVSGLSIDRDKENNEYILTVELILPQVEEKSKSRSEIITMEGDTISDAIRNFIKKTGKKLYWSHIKVLIISQDIAKESLLPVLDLFNRDAEIDHNVWILISRDKTAKDILEKGKPKLHDTISYHLDDMLKADKFISKYPSVNLWDLLDVLASDGSSPVMPAIKLSSGQEKIPQIDGTAVFKKDKLIGWLDGAETKSLLLVLGKLKGGIIVVPNIADTGTDVSLEIFRSKTIVNTMMSSDRLVIEINVNLDVAIAELSNNQDFINKEGREKVKKDAEELIKKQIEDLIQKSQKEYQSDILQFSSVIKREMPNFWKEIKPNWNSEFSTLESVVNVEVTISRSALTSKPIKVGD